MRNEERANNDFYYFGRNAPVIPDTYKKIIHKTQGHKRVKPNSVKYPITADFLEWVKNEFDNGIQGTSTDERRQCKLPEERSISN